MEQAALTEAGSSVEKALDVLFHLNAAGAAGVTEVARALALPKSTAHRLLAALARRGLVERDAQARYRPGIALVTLGQGVLDREPVVAAARPHLEAEARALGETIFLAAVRGGRLRVLDKAEGTGFLRAAPRVGEEVPVSCTASGKLYLAFAPEQVVASESSAPRSAPARRALADEVERVRRRGWAESREEWLPGLAVVAAPILVGAQMLGVVALAAPTVRLPAGQSARPARRLLAAARRIGATLEGRSAA
jgi:DNA-binding IclR family transcriptional regulator